MNCSPGVVGVDPHGLLPLDDDPGGRPEHDPAHEAGVSEAVGQVPQLTNVLQQTFLVDLWGKEGVDFRRCEVAADFILRTYLFDFLPDESKDPEDDDALDGGRDGAPLLRVPVLHHLKQELGLEVVTNESQRQSFNL